MFEKGTVQSLAAYLHSLRTGDVRTEAEDETELMRKLVDKYSNFTQHFPTKVEFPKHEVVIVTGATGNLGAFIIEELLKRPSVAEVWALVRAPGTYLRGESVIPISNLVSGTASYVLRLTSSSKLRLSLTTLCFCLQVKRQQELVL